MNQEQVIQMVNEVFVDSFEAAPEDLTPDAQLFTDLGLDSLDAVDLIVALQTKFGVKLRDDERVRSIRTLQDLYDFVARL